MHAHTRTIYIWRFYKLKQSHHAMLFSSHDNHKGVHFCLNCMQPLLDKHARVLASMGACMYAYSMHAPVYLYMRGRVHMFASMQSRKLMCRYQCSWQTSTFIYTHICKKYPLACAIMQKCIHVRIHVYEE